MPLMCTKLLRRPSYRASRGNSTKKPIRKALLSTRGKRTNARHKFRQMLLSLSFSLHLLWKRTRSSDHSPLWIMCSRHPDSETTQHAHIAPTVQQSFPAMLCPRDQEKQSKAHTNRCNTSFVVTKQTRAPGDSRRVNNVRHFVTRAHTHRPRLSVQPNHLHMVRRHWKNRRRGRHAVWQQLRVLKNKNNAKVFFIQLVSSRQSTQGEEWRLTSCCGRTWCFGVSGQPLRFGSAWLATHLGDDDFHIVGGVEANPAVLAAFAPALFVFVL